MQDYILAGLVALDELRRDAKTNIELGEQNRLEESCGSMLSMPETPTHGECSARAALHKAASTRAQRSYAHDTKLQCPEGSQVPSPCGSPSQRSVSPEPPDVGGFLGCSLNSSTGGAGFLGCSLNSSTGDASEESGVSEGLSSRSSLRGLKARSIMLELREEMMRTLHEELGDGGLGNSQSSGSDDAHAETTV